MWIIRLRNLFQLGLPQVARDSKSKSNPNSHSNCLMWLQASYHRVCVSITNYTTQLVYHISTLTATSSSLTSLSCFLSLSLSCFNILPTFSFNLLALPVGPLSASFKAHSVHFPPLSHNIVIRPPRPTDGAIAFVAPIKGENIWKYNSWP